MLGSMALTQCSQNTDLSLLSLSHTDMVDCAPFFHCLTFSFRGNSVFMQTEHKLLGHYIFFSHQEYLPELS